MNSRLDPGRHQVDQSGEAGVDLIQEVIAQIKSGDDAGEDA